MSNTVEERKSRDLMVRLIRAVDYIEKHQDHTQIKLPEPSIDPDSYFADLPEGFYDEDLEDIQSMNLEDVESELKMVGYTKDSVANNLSSVRNKNVKLFPTIDPKTSEKVAAFKLNDNVLSYIFKEALGQSFMLSKGEDTSTQKAADVVDQYDSREKILTRNNRYIQKAALALAVCAFASMTFAAAIPIMRHIDNLLTRHNVWNHPEQVTTSDNLRPLPVNNFNNKLIVNDLDLNYENAILLLNRIENGEVYLTVEEKRKLYEKMYSLAKVDQQKINETDDFYDMRRACTLSRHYKHVVRPKDTIANVVGNCSFTVNYDLSKIKEVLNIDDILLIEVNEHYEVVRIDIDKHKKSGIKNLF